MLIPGHQTIESYQSHTPTSNIKNKLISSPQSRLPNSISLMGKRLPHLHLSLSNEVKFSPPAPGELVNDQVVDVSKYDFSPLPRITWASFIMGVLVSMGGFMYALYNSNEANPPKGS